MRLLAISGSLRRRSYNTALLDAALAAAGPGVDVVRWTGLAGIPAYDQDLDAEPAAVELLKHEIARADAVLFATPEYNASVPGALKNALDWVSRPFEDNPLRGRPVAVIGASQGVFGAVWAQADLRRILGRMGARVDETELAVPRVHEALTIDGQLRDPRYAAAVGAIVDRLREETCTKAA